MLSVENITNEKQQHTHTHLRMSARYNHSNDTEKNIVGTHNNAVKAQELIVTATHYSLYETKKAHKEYFSQPNSTRKYMFWMNAEMYSRGRKQ